MKQIIFYVEGCEINKHRLLKQLGTIGLELEYNSIDERWKKVEGDVAHKIFDYIDGLSEPRTGDEAMYAKWIFRFVGNYDDDTLLINVFSNILVISNALSPDMFELRVIVRK